MFTAAALVPSPPVLVPECNGADAGPTAGLRNAALGALDQIAERACRWTAIGVGEVDQVVGSDAIGTFAGFGVGVDVHLAPGSESEPDPQLPLPALIAGWLRDHATPAAVVDVRIVAESTTPAACVEIGAALRGELDNDPEPHGLVVIADGSTMLTTKAPGSFDARAPEFQRALDAALTTGDVAAIAELDAAECVEFDVSGRAAWQVLAAVFTSVADLPNASTSYSAAPFGVGYHVGLWLP